MVKQFFLALMSLAVLSACDVNPKTSMDDTVTPYFHCLAQQANLALIDWKHTQLSTCLDTEPLYI